MKDKLQLDNEYQEFCIKATKACKDLNDAIEKLSPENLERFKSDFRIIFPSALQQLMHNLYKQ